MANPFVQPLSITLPDWLDQVVSPGDCLATETDRVLAAIDLSRKQVEQGTGGPFGALVCELDSGKVVGVGVNRVVPHNASIAHAEVVAWSGAQTYYQSFDLGADDIPALGLYSSAQPCVACWGGLFWTGLSRLVYGATKSDVESLAGFNEGPLPNDWDHSLRQVGIAVAEPCCRKQACEVLGRYAREGVIYNPNQKGAK